VSALEEHRILTMLVGASLALVAVTCGEGVREDSEMSRMSGPLPKPDR